MTSQRLSILIIGVLIALILMFNSYYMVTQSQMALVTEFGRPVAVSDEPGLKFKIPFIQAVEYFDKRIVEYRMPRAMEINAADQKRLVVGAFMKWRIEDPLKFLQTTKAGGIGADRVAVMNDRLANILEASLRQALGGVPLNALLTPKRSELMLDIRELVNHQVTSLKPEKDTEAQAGYGIRIVDVKIIRADLPIENSNAIFRRMQTEREREAKEFRAKGEEEAQRIRSKADKDRIVILAEAQKTAETARGEGDATASKIYADSFGKDPSFFEFYRTMQAYTRTLSSKDTTVVLNPNKGFLKGLEKE